MLVNGDVVLTESVAIVLYLAEKYRDKGLILAPRAQLHRWLMFAATELEQPLWRISRHTGFILRTGVCRARLSSPVRISNPWRRCGGTHEGSAVLRGGDKASVADFVLAYTLDRANEVATARRLSAVEGVCRADVRPAAGAHVHYKGSRQHQRVSMRVLKPVR